MSQRVDHRRAYFASSHIRSWRRERFIALGRRAYVMLKPRTIATIASTAVSGPSGELNSPF